MKPTIGKRAGTFTSREEKDPLVARYFVEINTHHNISMKRKFLFVEDVHTAININTLEERLKLKKWLIAQLQKDHSQEDLINLLSDSIDKDRHKLQKDFKITIL
ncbi:MAG: hypothetical protein KQI35_09985 [Bacteroidetes bacterium]|nr:hypothetical protein [Bacteroidota bacterium]